MQAMQMGPQLVVSIPLKCCIPNTKMLN